MINTSIPQSNATPRILITGGSGFVGKELIRNFCSNPSLSNLCLALRSKPLSSFGSGDICLVGDINPETDWQEALRGAEFVIHLAARVHVMNDEAREPLEEYRKANSLATIHLANESAKAGVKRFIYLSSIKVNGEGTKPGESYSEESPSNPLDPYGVSKWEAEEGLKTICAATGMEYVIIRPPLIYGPGVKANFRKLMAIAAKGIPLPFGSIHNQRSMLALENLVSFIAETIANPLAANQLFLLSDGEDLSTTRLLKLLAQGMKQRSLLLPIPAFIVRGLLKLMGQNSVAERLLDSLQIDSAKARQLLNWRPPLTAEKAIELVAQSYKNEVVRG